MAINFSNLASGIQTGRSLTRQAPPIAEDIGMQMQQNESILGFAEKLLSQHQTDISGLRKGQLELWYKAREKAAEFAADTDPDSVAQREYWEKYAQEIYDMDPSRWGMINSALKGGMGPDEPQLGAGGMLQPQAEIPVMPSAPPTLPGQLTPQQQNIFGKVAAAWRNFLNRPPAAVNPYVSSREPKPIRPGEKFRAGEKKTITQGANKGTWQYMGNDKWQRI